MKKLVLLIVLALTLTASMAGAVSWTSYLVAPNEDNSDLTYYAVKLDVDITKVGSQWDYVYKLTNLATGAPAGLLDYTRPLDRFTISNPGNLVPGDIFNITSPSGWSSEIDIYLLSWDAGALADRIAPGAFQTFAYSSYFGPAQTTTAAAINHRAFNGLTLAPTPVPEASTMVGFGSALLMAGPGMIGWIRRRK